MRRSSKHRSGKTTCIDAGNQQPINEHEITPETTTEITPTERTSTREGVSRHSFEILLEWARSQRNVDSPVALATARFKDGLADDAVDAWLEDRKAREQLAAAQQAAAANQPAGPIASERDDELLARFLAAIETRINPQSFLTWFRSLRLYRADRELTIVVPNQMQAEWITNNYFDVVEEALQEVGLADHSVIFRAEGT